jgi:hypothetical protein
MPTDSGTTANRQRMVASLSRRHNGGNGRATEADVAHVKSCLPDHTTNLTRATLHSFEAQVMARRPDGGDSDVAV